jgi:tRNA U34 5-methylaminomethyl-2-thiouridine-forming methyltransferase MnmC
MWTPELFRKVAVKMSPGGVLTTYCAKGAVRRNLRDAGFLMERLPGPKGKREMLRGIKMTDSFL